MCTSYILYACNKIYILISKNEINLMPSYSILILPKDQNQCPIQMTLL